MPIVVITSLIIHPGPQRTVNIKTIQIWQCPQQEAFLIAIIKGQFFVLFLALETGLQITYFRAYSRKQKWEYRKVKQAYL